MPTQRTLAVSATELIELPEGYTAAHVEQKEDAHFVRESSCPVDVDSNQPALLESLVAQAALSAATLASTILGDSNDCNEYNLSSVVSTG